MQIATVLNKTREAELIFQTCNSLNILLEIVNYEIIDRYSLFKNSIRVERYSNRWKWFLSECFVWRVTRAAKSLVEY